METDDIQILKINNPDFIQKALWSLIVNLADRMNTPGMSAHSLMTFFVYGVINKTIEIWGAIKDNKCLGFITFQVLHAPYYSMGACNYVYVEKTEFKKEIMQRFVEKFAEFIKSKNLKYVMFHSQYKRLANKWKEDLAQYDIDIKNEEYILIGKRKIGG